jgi:hypothetical protein
LKFEIYINGNENDFMKKLYDHGILFWYHRIQGANENILIWSYVNLLLVMWNNTKPKLLYSWMWNTILETQRKLIWFWMVNQTWVLCFFTLPMMIDWCKVIKFEFSMKSFPLLLIRNMQFNLHLLKIFIKKMCINYTKKFMWNCINFKYLKWINFIQCDLLLLGKTKTFNFLIWQLKSENMKKYIWKFFHMFAINSTYIKASKMMTSWT